MSPIPKSKLRREEVLTFVNEFWREHHYSPALRDICNACNVASTSVASAIVDRLQAAGHLTNQPGAARSIVPAWVHRALENGDNNGPGRDDTARGTTHQEGER